MDYSEGKEVDAAHVVLIPRELMGRLLSPEEAIELKGKLTDDSDPVAIGAVGWNDSTPRGLSRRSTRNDCQISGLQIEGY